MFLLLVSISLIIVNLRGCICDDTLTIGLPSSSLTCATNTDDNDRGWIVGNSAATWLSSTSGQVVSASMYTVLLEQNAYFIPIILDSSYTIVSVGASVPMNYSLISSVPGVLTFNIDPPIDISPTQTLGFYYIGASMCRFYASQYALYTPDAPPVVGTVIPFYSVYTGTVFNYQVKPSSDPLTASATVGGKSSTCDSTIDDSDSGFTAANFAGAYTTGAAGSVASATIYLISASAGAQITPYVVSTQTGIVKAAGTTVTVPSSLIGVSGGGTFTFSVDLSVVAFDTLAFYFQACSPCAAVSGAVRGRVSGKPTVGSTNLMSTLTVSSGFVFTYQVGAPLYFDNTANAPGSAVSASTAYLCNSFTPAMNHTVQAVSLLLSSASGQGSGDVFIFTSESGEVARPYFCGWPIATIAASSLSPTPTLTSIDLSSSPYSVTVGQRYWLCLYGRDAPGDVQWTQSTSSSGIGTQDEYNYIEPNRGPAKVQSTSASAPFIALITPNSPGK